MTPAAVNDKHSYSKGLLQQACRRGVDGFVAANVVLDRDRWVGVPKLLRCQLDTGSFVDCGRDGSAELVRSDAVDPGQIHDVAELAAYIVRRQWCALAGTEQQCVGVNRVQLPQSPLYSCRGKPRKLNRASGARCLRVILPRRRFAFRAGDGSGDAHGRHAQVDVTAADREHFTDACGSAQHDLDDCAELPIGFRPRDLAPGLPIRDRGADPGDLLWRECVRHPHIAMQPCNMIESPWVSFLLLSVCSGR